MYKSILITGGTDGIGKLAALKLAKDGHTIYIHGRNEEKVSGVISQIKEISNNMNIHGFVTDFSDLEAVSKLAKKIITDIPKLDVLINNAGIFKSKNDQTKAELDIRLVVNYLAPYMLTNAILPTLKKSESPRIINLSSAAQSPVSEKVLRGQEQVTQSAAYAQSKLALTMWSFYLAKQEPNITVIAVNPGSLLNTKMVKEAYGQHWSPADKGADIIYDLAVSEKHRENSAKYFDNDKGVFGQAHGDAYDERKIGVLMEVTEELVGRT